MMTAERAYAMSKPIADAQSGKYLEEILERAVAEILREINRGAYTALVSLPLEDVDNVDAFTDAIHEAVRVLTERGFYAQRALGYSIYVSWAGRGSAAAQVKKADGFVLRTW